MSYLQQVTIDPHLQLLALEMIASQNPQQHSMKKISFLMKTRKFADLQAQVTKLPGLSYPTLPQKLKEWQQKTAQLKKQLNDEKIFEVLRELDQKAKKQDEKSIDEGQLRVYKLAKILYDQGNISRSYGIINQLEAHLLSDELWLKTTWARLYCQIMLKKGQSKKTAERVREKLNTLDEEAGEEKIKHRPQFIQKQYAQKEELLNILPFAFFNHPSDEDLEKFFEICSDRTYFSVIQLTTPHIFRYMCVAMLLNKVLQKNRSFDLFKLTETINRGVVRYNDVIIEFIRAIYIDFDFQKASKKLQEIRPNLLKDPFLAPLADRIIENCQFLYYKVYCKVYQSVSIERIAEFVGKTPQQAEMWILRYIRSLDIDAKIDATRNLIITTKDQQQESQKYIELIPKMHTFINNLSRTAVNEDQQ